MIVKVCGITNQEDARLAIDLGANTLGFNFYPPSPRYLPPDEARPIVRGLPSRVLSVGIFVGLPDPSSARICEAVQLHGLAGQEEIPELGRRIFVATGPDLCHRFSDYEVIIDTSWGRGRLADWRAVRQLKRPFILSGGLTPDNVEEAIRELRPAGVDVCSGVEAEPGRKDPVLMRRFLERVQATLKRDEDNR